ncbi:DUF4259 domain-containing protein [Actinotalea sp. K2]|uniref:DUF4259 domain-containing protein n=1 Tax=Actinotalea sp. K2 TaxID=2939438 RepID=UPI0020177515|nr:DUF4259 domain-containing protein [Actinotalea sp. K2]MCL3861989.1 DUF4259 domain-containing protein [Actinotalea sp. K2]
MSAVFEADDAADLLAELEERSPGRRPALLRRVLARIVAAANGYLELPAAAAGLAAAALVAVARNGDLAQGDEHLEGLTAFPVDTRLHELATAALDRLTDPRDNEWLEAWEESGALTTRLGDVAHWRQALTRPAVDRPAVRRVRRRPRVPPVPIGATFLRVTASGRHLRAVVVDVDYRGETIDLALVGPAEPSSLGGDEDRRPVVVVGGLQCSGAAAANWPRLGDVQPQGLRGLAHRATAAIDFRITYGSIPAGLVDQLIEEANAQIFEALAWRHDPLGIAAWREDLAEEYRPWVETTEEAIRDGAPASDIAALLSVRCGGAHVDTAALERYAEDAHAYIESWMMPPD